MKQRIIFSQKSLGHSGCQLFYKFFRPDLHLMLHQERRGSRGWSCILPCSAGPFRGHSTDVGGKTWANFHTGLRLSAKKYGQILPCGKYDPKFDAQVRNIERRVRWQAFSEFSPHRFLRGALQCRGDHSSREGLRGKLSHFQVIRKLSVLKVAMRRGVKIY